MKSINNFNITDIHSSNTFEHASSVDSLSDKVEHIHHVSPDKIPVDTSVLGTLRTVITGTDTHSLPGSFTPISETDPLSSRNTSSQSTPVQIVGGMDASKNSDFDKFDTAELLYGNAFLSTANKYNVIISLRTPSAIGQTLLKEGYPTKNLHVKAKSSLTGPTAGFIAADERFSKALPGVQKKYIDQAIIDGSKKVNLTLSDSRIKELMELKHIIKKDDNGTFSAKYVYKDPALTPVEVDFHIDQKGSVFYKSTGEPVQTLTNGTQINQHPNFSVNDKPITADYDLFSVIAKESQSDNIAPRKITPKLNSNALNPKQLQYLNDNSPMDMDLGNVSSFTTTIINDINKNAEAEYSGGPLVWHGDESNNPFSEGFDENDKPIFIIPNENKFICIKNREELAELYEMFEQKGYKPDFSPRLAIRRRSSVVTPISGGSYDYLSRRGSTSSNTNTSSKFWKSNSNIDITSLPRSSRSDSNASTKSLPNYLRANSNIDITSKSRRLRSDSEVSNASTFSRSDSNVSITSTSSSNSKRSYWKNEGAYEEKCRTAKKLLGLGAPYEIIMTVTSLDKTTLDSLAKEL
ncbi:anthrax toxin-like adenylyl cyclase domain-containing protein [Citrobacter portucalensis]|uniref:anthrax toxin-like adenylyl cyclase domain-containing protein n=1 Tax=Citrobacter portucalensis TaxID=1639133 RepID=UPI00226B992C|nr:anthrax toxin-like adenylyl cyclase domain-containing protein [Citrobacter portucalensis]MCX8986039.1 CyaA/EF/ExoY family adenylyl cyclase toxin [Citrobacter portucalensis]